MRGFLSRRKAFPVAELDALVHEPLELAAVVIPQRGRRVGELARRNQVAAPDLGGVHADRPRGVLDQPLGEIGRLRASGAAIGPALRGIGEQALRHDVHGLDVVGLRNEAHRERSRRQRRADEIGAELEQTSCPQRQNLAVLVERELAVIDGLATAMVGQHAFRPARYPLHRAAQAAPSPEHQRVVGKRVALEAEAAANIGSNDADTIFGHVEDVRHFHAHAVRVLRSGVERVGIVGGVVVANGHSRLHGDRGKPVVLDPQLHHVPGLGEGGVGRILVAEHEAESDVALWAIVPDFGGAVLGGIFEVHHRRQRFIVDLDQFGGIARLTQRLGDDERDAVADEAHLFGIEDRLERAVALGSAEVLGHQVGGEAAQLLRHRVSAGEHTEHARRGLGLGNVDALDASVGVRRQHRHPVALPGQADVVDVASLSEQETLVFHSPHSLSDAELGHVRLAFWSRCDGFRPNVSGDAALTPAWPGVRRA